MSETELTDEVEKNLNTAHVGLEKTVQVDSQSVGAPLCDICKERPSKYTFTCCRWRCCGPECYSVHRETPTSGGEGGEADAGSDGLASCGGPQHSRITGVRSGRFGVKSGRFKPEQYDNVEDELNQETLLTDEQKTKLENASSLSKWFDAVALRRAVRSIEAAPSRTERLAELLHDEEFATFISDLMDVLDIGKDIPVSSGAA